MILIDTGPLVALFDPQDRHHVAIKKKLKLIKLAPIATLPVLTEAFHLLEPSSQGSVQLQVFISKGGLSVWLMEQSHILRSLELMKQYRDQEMDLADASLVAAAEYLQAKKILTLDKKDFTIYKIKKGNHWQHFEII